MTPIGDLMQMIIKNVIKALETNMEGLIRSGCTPKLFTSCHSLSGKSDYYFVRGHELRPHEQDLLGIGAPLFFLKGHLPLRIDFFRRL